RRGGSAPAVYNAANEQAVALFLDGRILFGDIPRAIESALDSVGNMAGATREDLLAADASARRHVRELF
ncbi:MAG: 1-deoxy-D-xylulose-5-phosphate reductoisomerase, partial [Gemmatimonadaceae bacterium]